MKIAFRIDMGHRVGMGHFIRMSALAEALEDLGGICAFFTSSDEPINYSGFDIIIVDTYQVTSKYIAALNHPGRLVVCFDDDALYTYSCDMLINTNFYAKKLAIRTGEKKPKMLLGSKYALLRREFRDASPISVNQFASRIFVCFGGSDMRNFTPFAIKSLVGICGAHLVVVLGEQTLCDEEVFQLKSLDVEILKAPKSMVDIMRRCDVAVIASGSMVYEIASIGLPAIVVTQADNQMLISQYLEREELMKWAGDWNKVQAYYLGEQVEALLNNPKRRAHESKRLIEAVDKDGAHNAAKVIMEVSNEIIGKS